MEPSKIELCPRCQIALKRRSAGSVSGLVCEKCGGVWIARDMAQHFQKAVANKGEVDFSESARILAETSDMRAKKTVSTKKKDLPCPKCYQPMKREWIARAHFEIDICDAHGVFFDRGELAQVAFLVGAKAPAPLENPEQKQALKAVFKDGEIPSNGAAAAFAVIGFIFEMLSD